MNRANRPTGIFFAAFLLLLSSPLPHGVAVAAGGDSPAGDAPPPASEIMQRMKAALEPQRASLREIEITVSDKETRHPDWLAYEARKHLADGNRIAFTLVRPAELRGSGLLVNEPTDGGVNAEWIYVPALERIRKIVPVTAFQPFLGTDFTYSDLGFVNLTDRSFRLLGVDGEGAGRVYLVEEVPKKQWYYSRIVHHISAANFLPVQRDIYSPAGDLWKQEFFEDVETVEGIQTPRTIRMVDLPNGGATELRIRDIRYDQKIPDDLFSPDSLPTLASRPVWKWSASERARAQ